jgi:DNA processing protein
LATTGQQPAGAATSRAPVPADRHAAPPAARAAQSPDRADAAPLRDAILARLSPSPLAEDQLIRDLARTAAQVAPALVLLELEGRVQRQPGGLLALCLPG